MVNIIQASAQGRSGGYAGGCGGGYAGGHGSGAIVLVVAVSIVVVNNR